VCSARAGIRELKSIFLFADKQPTPSLLPILRSQQQGEILALLLGLGERHAGLDRHLRKLGEAR
jgi:hypothetical protein